MRVIIGLVLWAAGSVAVAECLHVVERDFQTHETEVGAQQVEWRAVLENRCDAAFDADLTIQFLDGSGDTLYEVRDLATLATRESTEVGKVVYMPKEYVPQIKALEILLDERERPY